LAGRHAVVNQKSVVRTEEKGEDKRDRRRKILEENKVEVGR
jgi:hypothetical protein